MNYSYNISHKVVQNVYEFSKLSERLNILKYYPHWDRRLQSIVANESILSAISYGTPLTDKWILRPSSKVISKILSTDNLKDYQNYSNTYQFIDSYANEGKITELTIKNINSLIVNGRIDTNEYRNSEKLIKKLVSEDNEEIMVDVKNITKPEEIESEMAELVGYINENMNVISPILLASIVHFSLAKIHPFQFANGRLMRIFDKLILKLNGENYKYFMLEDFYLRNIIEYNSIIERTVESNDLTEWIDFYTNGLLFSLGQSYEILRVITGGAINLFESKIVDLTNREIDLIEIYNEKEVASASEVGKILKITRQTANQLVKGLVRKKLLKPIGSSTSLRYKLITSPSESMMLIK